jgi:hypothetical protein
MTKKAAKAQNYVKSFLTGEELYEAQSRAIMAYAKWAMLGKAGPEPFHALYDTYCELVERLTNYDNAKIERKVVPGKKLSKHIKYR